MELESYSFVLLRRGPSAGDFSDADLDRLQAAHLDHLDAMTRAGHLVAAGPFSDQPDETVRGFCVYACPLEKTRELAGSDPSVRAGRMAVDVMTWWTPAGSISFHRAGMPQAGQT
jgi:uncharacterized protein